MKSEERQTKHAGGRPKKPVKKAIITGVRFSEAEYIIVKQKATIAGLRITVYIRYMALEGKVIPLMNEEQRHFVRQLVGMANNLNQLTKKGHQEGLLTAILLFENYRNQFDELLKHLKHDK